ncbi:cytochrome b [Capsicum annuum]|uniref:Cytochrome b n=1 Tax=Capsicum annuum TaxID=4072 RepID=A0A2G3AAD4_CAPAN|nr:cytochrome b [Capsicum annuum]
MGQVCFFIVVHLHIFFDLYHASYSSLREFVRCLGVVIFLLMIMDKIASYPYFYVKDLVGWVAFAMFFSIWIFYASNILGHPDNFIPANPMSTPPYIGGVATIAPVFIWFYSFLKVCMYLVQVFVRFTKEYFGCLWRIAYC